MCTKGDFLSRDLMRQLYSLQLEHLRHLSSPEVSRMSKARIVTTCWYGSLNPLNRFVWNRNIPLINRKVSLITSSNNIISASLFLFLMKTSEDPRQLSHHQLQVWESHQQPLQGGKILLSKMDLLKRWSICFMLTMSGPWTPTTSLPTVDTRKHTDKRTHAFINSVKQRTISTFSFSCLLKLPPLP